VKKKFIFILLVNLIPYLILLLTLLSAYSDKFNQVGTILSTISIIIFIIIFIFNIYYIPKIIIARMPKLLLLKSRVIGISISIGLNIILFMSVGYTHAYIDYYVLR